MISRSMRLLAVVTAVSLGLLVASARPAHAAGAAYGAWTVAGANPSWTGTMNVPVAGFPAATFTSNSSSTQVRSGATVFLGPATPFGAVFGSSQNQPYLGLGTATGLQPSTTAFTFAQPTPASGWGFNLGDVDADHVQVSASGPDGPLTADELGFQGGFNYCDTSPRPGGCTRPPFTDIPTWDPATSILAGNVLDTDGSSGWFRPTKPVTTLTFRFEILSGVPAYQIWFAALKSDVVGSLVQCGSSSPPPGTVVNLRLAPGGPVVGSTSPDAGGNFRFGDVAAAIHELTVDVPPGFVAPPPRTVDARNGDVTGLALCVQPAPPPTTVPPTTVPPTTMPPPPTTVPQPPMPSPARGIPDTRAVRPGRMIPATGGSNDLLLPLGLVLVGLGAGCVRLSRRLRAV